MSPVPSGTRDEPFKYTANSCCPSTCNPATVDSSGASRPSSAGALPRSHIRPHRLSPARLTLLVHSGAQPKAKRSYSIQKRSNGGCFKTLQEPRLPNTGPAGVCLGGRLVAYLLDGPESKRIQFSASLTAAEPARSRPAFCHFACFVICYTNPRPVAQVFYVTISNKKEHAPPALQRPANP